MASPIRKLVGKGANKVRPQFETSHASSMFNIYKSMNKKEELKEPAVIGHERFYQPRTSRSGSRRKKPVPKRTHSASEFSASALTMATRRAAFRNRSLSSENKSSESLNRRFSVERNDSEAYIACIQGLEHNERYQFIMQLNEIGSRAKKHWFTVMDVSLSTERLLTLLPLPKECPLLPSSNIQKVLLNLFRGLQHPYIHPILDIEFWNEGAALISPVNPTGTLKDLIHGTSWLMDYSRKYSTRGEGLPLGTVQCLGRQILEGLLFLKNRYFPPFQHLHSGNIIIQNGVARIAGLENSLFGIAPRTSSARSEVVAFGYLLFEMSAGYELKKPPSPAHLQIELERAPKVVDTLNLIFLRKRAPSLEELVWCEAFRGVELRELRGASNVQVWNSPEVVELLKVLRNATKDNKLF